MANEGRYSTTVSEYHSIPSEIPIGARLPERHDNIFRKPGVSLPTLLESSTIVNGCRSHAAPREVFFLQFKSSAPRSHVRARVTRGEQQKH